MRSLSVALPLLFAADLAAGAEHASWTAYMKENRYACPGPMDTLATPQTLEIGGKRYKHTGSELIIDEQSLDADSSTKIGVLSAIKDVTANTKNNVTAALEWFKSEKVDWLVVNGDLALEELDLEEVVEMLAGSGLPLLVVLGNSESKGSWARAYGDRIGKYPNLVNGTWVRRVVSDDVELWTVSGYHDKKFVHQGAGCLYKQEHIDALAKLTPSGKGPLVLVSHGPPLGKGKHALDWITDKKNVGDPMLTALIDKKAIPFGLFGHILEAGGSAVGKDMATTVAKGKPATHLYINAGSASADPWGMNDGTTAYGMALLFSIEAGKARYDVKRFSAAPEE